MWIYLHIISINERLSGLEMHCYRCLLRAEFHRIRQRTHVAIPPRFPPRFPLRFQGFQAFAGPIPGPAITIWLMMPWFSWPSRAIKGSLAGSIGPAIFITGPGIVPAKAWKRDGSPTCVPTSMILNYISTNAFTSDRKWFAIETDTIVALHKYW